jgi:hypothetical protein
MRRLTVLGAALVALSIARLASADAIIVDRLPTGDPICCLDGFSSEPDVPFIVAGSFIFAGPSGTLLRTVGLYLQRYGTSLDGTPSPGSGTPLRFEVLGDDMNLPDVTAMPPVTGDASSFAGVDYLPSQTTSLSLVTALLDIPVPLLNGSRYWIAASTLPFSSSGAYLFGVGAGTGAFAASFDPTGTTFFNASDLGIDPMTDLAIYAAGTEPVPEPATLALLGAGMLALAARRYRSKFLQASDHS